MSGWNGKKGVYIIAEIGGNHEGDFEYAKKLTRLACKTGVDAVKFQVYTGETLVSKVESPDRHAHFQRFELTPDQYIALAQICKKAGVTFAASVWNIQAIEWLDPYMEYYKIGSGDLTALPILRRIASIGKPIILSTGLATMDEVFDAVSFIQSQNPVYKNRNHLGILQCTSMYPIPNCDANLNVMKTFSENFKATIGYSDHTIGPDAVELAIAMGAEIVEVHFTDSREGKTFRDHKVSFTPEEIKQLIEKIEKVHLLQGSPNKIPADTEVENGHIVSFRRAVYPVRDLSAGTILTEDLLTILRPNHGIDARHYYDLIGRKLKKDKKAFEKLDWQDVNE